jgi:hypothetical protein
MTTREQLHSLIDELSDAHVEAELVRLIREQQRLEQWFETEARDPEMEQWALESARRAISEDLW